MYILTVIPLKKINFKEELTYFSTLDIALGSIVSISIRNQKMLGLVIAKEIANNIKSELKNLDFKIKKIDEAKENSIFKNEYIETILKISEYFLTNKSQTASYLLPSVIKDNYDEISKTFSLKEDKKNTNNVQGEKLLFQDTEEERMDYYKTYIRQSFANKKSVFIVFGTENKIKDFEEKIKKGIEEWTVSLYSGLSEKKILNNILKIGKEDHPMLILGTAPFLSIPRYDIATIVLEQENNQAYKTIVSPYFDLRVFVETYAFLANIKLIIGDNLLRFETIARKDEEHLAEIKPLSYRIKDNVKIEINQRQKEGNEFNIFNKDTILKIKEALNQKKKVFIFTLRKGLAGYTICHDCGEEVLCDECKTPVTLYKSNNGEKRIFTCNQCKVQKETLMTCPYCTSWNLLPLGIGIDKVKEELDKSLGEINILQLDKENIKTNKQAIELIKKFDSLESGILLGTEVSFNYIKEKVDLSIIASFDTLFTIPNYKITEKIISIVLNTINISKEEFIIETKNSENEILTEIQNKNLLYFIRGELEARKNLGYPPYQKFIKIVFEGNKEEINKTKGILEDMFKKYDPIVYNSFLKSKKNQFLLTTLIKIDPIKWQAPYLSKNQKIDENLKIKLKSLPKFFTIKIDPEDLI